MAGEGGRAVAQRRWGHGAAVLTACSLSGAQSILGVMSTTFFFVDTSGSSPVPVGEAQHLTPFGQDLGWSNTTCATYLAASGLPVPD